VFYGPPADRLRIGFGTFQGTSFQGRCSTAEYWIVRYLITNSAASNLEKKLNMNVSKIAGDISEIAGDPVSELRVKKIIIPA
jgi:hypothetical protein